MIKKKIKLNNNILSNRIVISPMCQYSSVRGSPTNWHYKHLSNLILSGASMLIIESTAVSKIGRITHNDLGLYNKIQEQNFFKLIKFLKSIKNIPICLQISHSGRKGSCNLPWINYGEPLKKNKWKTISSSNLKRDVNWPVPKKANLKDIKKIISQFENTANRAIKVGFDGIEIHMAHGYLIHQFLSPICNTRNDEYGGSVKKRCRLSLEITKKIKKILPNNKILGIRLTGSDHLNKGISMQDSIFLAKKLKKLGANYICVSSGGIIKKTNLNINKDAFRVSMTGKIKKNLKNVLVGTTGRLENLKKLKKNISSKKLDLAFIGRPFLKNSNWLYESLDANYIPKQYEKAFGKKDR
tara:strand:- start:9653 stop:10717 length:1065 start_codon:yes stop_codon:yes gene_type:complete